MDNEPSNKILDFEKAPGFALSTWHAHNSITPPEATDDTLKRPLPNGQTANQTPRICSVPYHRPSIQGPHLTEVQRRHMARECARLKQVNQRGRFFFQEADNLGLKQVVKELSRSWTRLHILAH
jgi:hypothetical protein